MIDTRQIFSLSFSKKYPLYYFQQCKSLPGITVKEIVCLRHHHAVPVYRCLCVCWVIYGLRTKGVVSSHPKNLEEVDTV
jgi:hypothetical protein